MLFGLLLAVSLRAAHELVGAGVLPALVTDLGGESLAGAFFAAFSAACALGILCGGIAADRFGPTRTFAVGLAGFALGMLATGLAPTMPAVIAARALEGFAAGMFSCVVSAVVMRAYEDAARPRVLAALSAAWVVPGLLAPAGAVSAAAAFGWRAVFVGLVPLAGIAGVLALPRLWRLDAGAPSAGEPVGPRAVLGDAGLRAALATRAGVVVAFFGVESFLPLAFERVLAASDAQRAALLTLAALFWTGGAYLQAHLDARVSATALARVGACLLVAGIAVVALALVGEVSIGAALAGWATTGLGMGIAYQAATAAAMRSSRLGNEGAIGAALGITDALSMAASTALCGEFLAHQPLVLGAAPVALLAGFAVVSVAGLASIATARRLRGPSAA